MTKQEIIDYMYKNHVQGDFKIEEMAEDLAKPDLQPTCNNLATDIISRQAAIDAVNKIAPVNTEYDCTLLDILDVRYVLTKLPPAEPEWLTNDDFETIRIHLNAYKEKLCNQQRWEEAEEYQRIIDRFMAFASAEPERKKGEWIYDNPNTFKCSKCNKYLDIGCGNMKMNFCPNCGADMRGDKDEDR